MKLIKLLFVTLICVACFANLSNASSIEVEAQWDFNQALTYAFGPANIDTLVLITSGGVYTSTGAWGTPPVDTTYMRILKPIVIMAKPGLAEKPIFTHSDPDSNALEMFRIFDDVEFNGVVFDGLHPAGTYRAKYAIRVGHHVPDPVNPLDPPVYVKFGMNITLKNCDFKNFYDYRNKAEEYEGHAIYYLKPNAGEPTIQTGNVIIENCTFTNIGDEAIRMTETEKYFATHGIERVCDTLIVRNCTFKNISSECIRFYADLDTSTQDAYILIEHLTIDSSATRTAYIKNNQNAIYRDVIVSNSRYPKTSRWDRGDYIVELQQRGSHVSHIDTFNIVYTNPADPKVRCTKGGTVDTTTVYAYDPWYTDPHSFDYTLLPSSPMYGLAYSGLALGDSRWIDPHAAGIDDEDFSVVPEKYTLNQNYPNPFNPTTTISYSVSKSSHVVLEVFNVTGSKIATLENTYKDAGNYSVNWHPNNNASAIYYYKLSVDGQSLVKKMLFIK